MAETALTAEEIARWKEDLFHARRLGEEYVNYGVDLIERLLAAAEQNIILDIKLRASEALKSGYIETCQRLTEQHAEMLAVLRSVEWEGFDVICDDVCPKCGERKPDGHALDCTLSAAIKNVGG